MRSATFCQRLLIAGILTALPISSSARAEEWESGRLETAIYAGIFDTAATSPPAEAGIEIRRTLPIDGFSLLGGLTGNGDGGAWVYGGARFDWELGSRWAVAPGFAVSLYEQGDGKDLGHTLEFRSSIEVARRFSDRLRVGFAFYHLSNASISETNPGANSAVLSLAFRRPRAVAE